MSTSGLPPRAFQSANPHALATILEAAETRRIIAATDIFDISGIKLWAGNQPVSAELQRKLQDRQLKKPLESSLVAEDGVSPSSLVRAVEKLAGSDSALVPLVQPRAAQLMQEAARLTLHPVAQLLLTATQESRPAAFDHAIAAMCLAGCLMAESGGEHMEVRRAMLCGLLHDLGDLYIAPEHGEADADRDLDVESYRQLVAHPHVGFLLVSQLTEYPVAVAQAIAEHHERLDGSGYPRALQGSALSPLGRLLATTEAALNALRSSYDHLLHASVALRAVPGEFDMAWVGLISGAANRQPPQDAVLPLEDIEARLQALGQVLTAAESRVDSVLGESSHPQLRAALELSAFLLSRLRVGWNAGGLWNPQAMVGADAAEVEALEDELYFRLRGVERATLLRAGTALPAAEAAALNELCQSLSMGGG